MSQFFDPCCIKFRVSLYLKYTSWLVSTSNILAPYSIAFRLKRVCRSLHSVINVLHDVLFENGGIRDVIIIYILGCPLVSASLRKSTRRLCPCSLVNATQRSGMWMPMPHWVMEWWCRFLENCPTMVSPWGSSCKRLYLLQRWVAPHYYQALSLWQIVMPKLLTLNRNLQAFYWNNW